MCKWDCDHCPVSSSRRGIRSGQRMRNSLKKGVQYEKDKGNIGLWELSAFRYYMTPMVGVGGILSVVGREWESFMAFNGSLKPGQSQRCNKCSSQFC